MLCYAYIQYAHPHLWYSQNRRLPDYLIYLSTCLPSLTSSQPNSLAVLLQLRYQAIALLDDVRILLVLVVRPVGLDDLVDPIDGAWDAVCCDELGEVPDEDEY